MTYKYAAEKEKITRQLQEQGQASSNRQINIWSVNPAFAALQSEIFCNQQDTVFLACEAY